MSIERKIVATSEYLGSHIVVRHMGPDLLVYVDDSELGGFFVNVPAAIAGGHRHVDQQLKEERAKNG